MSTLTRLILFLFLINLLPNLASSQINISITENSPRVSFDPAISKLKFGDIYAVTINNVNTYVYDIIIDSKDTIFEKPIQVPTFEGFNIGSLSSLIELISPPGITVPPIPYSGNLPFSGDSNLVIAKTLIEYKFKAFSDNEEAKDSLLNDFCSPEQTIFKQRIQQEKKILLTFQSYRDSILDDIEIFTIRAHNHNYLTQGIFPQFDESQKLHKSINRTIIQLNESQQKYLYEMQMLTNKKERDELGHLEIMNAYKSLMKDYSEFNSLLQKAVENLFVKRINFEKGQLISDIGTRINRINNLINDLQETVTKWESKAKLLTGIGAFDYDRSINLVKLKVFVIKVSLSNKRKRLVTLQKNYTTESNKFIAFGTKDEDIMNAHKSVLSTYDSTYNLINKIFESISAEKISKIHNVIVNIANNVAKTYTHTGQLRSDQTELTIRLVPRDSTLRLQSYKTVLLFPIQKSFYWGTGLGLYYTNFFEDVYSFRDSAPNRENQFKDTSYFAVKEDVLNHEIGLHASVNFGWYLNRKSNLGMGISVGPGITIGSKIKPRILFGANVSYGRRNKIYLGIGGIAGYVDKTSNAVTEDLIFTSKPESLVVSKLSTRLSVSMGYFYIF